jgi:hypothetical protein
MTKRIQKLALAVAALAALSLGGAVFAQAQSPSPAASEGTAAPDRDNVQSGDQTTPDTAKAAARHARDNARRHIVLAAGRAHGNNGQSGDQTASDNGAASEQIGAENPEQPGAESESASGADGPGGHADEPGNSNADHQFQGNE